jgi:hypothetical protein
MEAIEDSDLLGNETFRLTTLYDIEPEFTIAV